MEPQPSESDLAIIATDQLTMAAQSTNSDLQIIGPDQSSAATQAEGNLLPEGFPKFPDLPPELQLKIWKFAAPLCHKLQFIPFSLTDPAKTDNTIPDRGYPIEWQHLWSTDLPIILSPLLSTCVKSRTSAKAFYKNSFGPGWENGSDTDFEVRNQGIVNNNIRDREICPLMENLRTKSKELCWKPEVDVVVIKQEKEPHTCEETYFCRDEHNSYSFIIDRRTRFIVMPQDIIDIIDADTFDEIPMIDTLDIINVEVVFVMVNKDKFMEETPRPMRRKDIEGELTMEMKEIESNLDLHLYHSYDGVAEDDLRDEMVRERAGDWPLAKAVTSLDEVTEFVADWNIKHRGMKMYADEDRVIGA